MYEAKYKRYITKSQSRFAEREEILRNAVPFSRGRSAVKNAGVPLYYTSGKLYVDSSDSHSIIIGPTGCKKTRTTVFTTVGSIIEAGESAVINDPKGEIYRKTAGRAQAAGAKVYVLNLRRPGSSHCWNPMAQAYRYHSEGREAEAIQSINDFVDSVCAPNTACTADRYWIDSAKIYLTALALSLMDSVPLEHFNIRNLIQMCYEENRHGLRNLLAEMDPASTASFGLHTVLDLDAEKTRSCIFSTLFSALSPFTQNSVLQNMLCGSSFDIAELGDTQTIVYVIYPDERQSLSFLVNAFFTQCYETLIVTAGEKVNERLSVRVNFVLDEFSNLPQIPSFDNRISEARSRNIRYFLYIQSFNQLKQKYSECAETILSNCSNWLCFSSKEIEFLSKLSAVCGKEVDYNGIEHDLVSPFDMQHLVKEREFAEVLIVRQGEYPYVAELPDIDYVEPFASYKEVRLSDIEVDNNGKFLSFRQWVDGIHTGRFRFPFHKSAAKRNPRRSASA